MSAVATLPLNPTLVSAWQAGPGAAHASGAGVSCCSWRSASLGLVMGRQAEWRVLYANLADKDGGAIVAQLSTMNVPYKHAEGGGAILVPADRVHDTRLRWRRRVAQGLGGGFRDDGGEPLWHDAVSGAADVSARSGRGVDPLDPGPFVGAECPGPPGACPTRTGFFRSSRSRRPRCWSACIPGRVAGPRQLAGIVHLVASSVPEMAPSAVSVLDDTGKLLSTPPMAGRAPTG
jgi:flagellar M-ring protein FliF